MLHLLTMKAVGFGVLADSGSGRTTLPKGPSANIMRTLDFYIAVSVNWGGLLVGVLGRRALFLGVYIGPLIFGNPHIGDYENGLGQVLIKPSGTTVLRCESMPRARYCMVCDFTFETRSLSRKPSIDVQPQIG